MIQITPSSEILVAVNPIDFRCGIESLCGIIKSKFNEDPFGGKFFIFTNRPRRGFKIIYYDGQGFWLFQKRFSEGKLVGWPSSEEEVAAIDSKNFLLLLYNGDIKSGDFQKNWRDI